MRHIEKVYQKLHHAFRLQLWQKMRNLDDSFNRNGTCIELHYELVSFIEAAQRTRYRRTECQLNRNLLIEVSPNDISVHGWCQSQPSISIFFCLYTNCLFIQYVAKINIECKIDVWHLAMSRPRQQIIFSYLSRKLDRDPTLHLSAVSWSIIIWLWQKLFQS